MAPSDEPRDDGAVLPQADRIERQAELVGRVLELFDERATVASAPTARIEE